MTFFADEASGQSSSPREYFDIVIGATTYHLCSGTRDLLVGSTLYTAIAMMRGDVGVLQVASGGENVFKVTLPIDHAIVRRWLQQGVPPKSCTVTAYRMQVRSGLSEQLWTGPVVSVYCPEGGASAELHVASLLGEPIRRRLPTLRAGRQCNHVLYDNGCRIDRADTGPGGFPYKCSTTVISVNGRDVRVDLSTVTASDAQRATWLVLGELVVTSGAANGERMTIREQNDLAPGVNTVTVVSLHLQIPGLRNGDSVDLFAGCSHSIEQCGSRFLNQVNYGGFPQQPQANPFFKGGFGIIEQT